MNEVSRGRCLVASAGRSAAAPVLTSDQRAEAVLAAVSRWAMSGAGPVSMADWLWESVATQILWLATI